MANNYIDLPESGGSGSGVTSLNSLSGALSLVAGSGITITPSGSTILISSTSSGGTVTSVGLADSTGLFNITGSPVTTVGTLTLSSFKSQSANTFLAAPNGSSGAPTFRAIVAADIPILNQNTTGTAANITATSNSTLTTLSALSLPYSQVTGGPSTNAITALTGDGTASGPGSVALTLATVNTNTGSFGGASSVPSFTVNGKGLITAASSTAVVAPAGTLSGTTLNATVVTSSLTSVGTIGTGTWAGTTIAINHGGTGQTTANAAFAALSPMTTNYDLITQIAGVPARLAVSPTNATLNSVSGVLTWVATPSPYAVSTINSNTNAVSGTTYLCDTSGGSFTVTLPTPVNGAFITIKDKTGSFQTNNLTLAQNASEQIEGLAASKLLQTNWGGWSIFSDGTNWYMGPF